MSKRFQPRRSKYKLRAAVCAFGRLGTGLRLLPAAGHLGVTMAQARLPQGGMAIAGICHLPQGHLPSNDQLAVVVAFGSHAASVLRKAEAAGNVAEWAALARAAYRHPDLSGWDLVRLSLGRPLGYVVGMLEALGRITPMADNDIRPWLDRYKREPEVAEALAAAMIRSAVEQGLPLDPLKVDQAIQAARRSQARSPARLPSLAEAADEEARLVLCSRLALAVDDPHLARLLDHLRDPLELLRISRRYLAAPAHLQGAARGLLVLSRAGLQDPGMIDRSDRLAALAQVHRQTWAKAGLGAFDLVVWLDPALSAGAFAMGEALLTARPWLHEAMTGPVTGERLLAVAQTLVADGKDVPGEGDFEPWLAGVRAVWGA